MDNIYKNGIGNLTPEALKPSRTGERKFSVLPPILCKRDKDVIDSIYAFIDKELQILKLKDASTLDASRFAIFRYVSYLSS